jgi:curved DNA-binding protein CbpA
MKNRRNYYRILQVQPDAPIEIIRASYRTMMRELKLHPDLGGSNLDASLLNEAYEALSDPERRAAYDQELCLLHRKQESFPGRSPISAFCPFCRSRLERKPRPGECCPTCDTPLQSKKPTSAQRAYQRSIVRMPRHDRIYYRTSWPGKAREATMLDFSPKGIRFLCPERLTAGATVKISSPLFEASAVVRNVSEEVVERRVLYAIGVSFLAISFTEPKGSFLSTCA